MNNLIKINDWYKNLVDDCQTIIVERGYRARMEIIEGYHELGERIETDINFKKWSNKRGGAIRQLADDIRIGMRTLYFAIQFYERYPELSNVLESFEEGKNISWHKIVNKYLTGPKKETIILPEGKYNVIYADPPWEYGDKFFEELANLGSALKVESRKQDFSSGESRNISARIAKRDFSVGPRRIYARNVTEY